MTLYCWRTDVIYVKRSRWKRLPLRNIDQTRYGRTQLAYRRDDDALLLLHRPRSRNAKWYDRIATWALVLDDVLVARQHLYGRRVRSTPIRWANGVLRKWTAGAPGASCHLYKGRRPTVIESLLYSAPPLRELPRSLVRLPGRSAEMPDLTVQDDNARLQFPNKPPLQLSGRAQTGVLFSVDECFRYAANYELWLNDHPTFAEQPYRADLHLFLMHEIAIDRIALMLKRTTHKSQLRLLQLYHNVHRQMQAIRERLGATRRHRLI